MSDKIIMTLLYLMVVAFVIVHDLTEKKTHNYCIKNTIADNYCEDYHDLYLEKE